MSEPLGLQSPEWRESRKEKVKGYTYRLALMLPFCLCPEHMEAEPLASQSKKCGSTGSRQLARVVSRVLLPLETGQLAGSPRSTVPVSTSLGYLLFFSTSAAVTENSKHSRSSWRKTVSGILDLSCLAIVQYTNVYNVYKLVWMLPVKMKT